MKKILSIIIILCSTLLAIDFSPKQILIKTRFIVATSSSTINSGELSDIPNLNVKRVLGLNAGIETPLNFPVVNDILLGIHVKQLGWKEKYDYSNESSGSYTTKSKYRTKYLTLNVQKEFELLKLVPKLQDTPINVVLGLETGTFIGAKQKYESKWEYNGSSETDSETEKISRSEWKDRDGKLGHTAIIAGLRATISPSIGLQLSYIPALGSLFKDLKAKNRSINAELIIFLKPTLSKGDD